MADLIKKRGKCFKSHTLAPKLTLYFSDLRSLILRYNNVRGPTFSERERESLFYFELKHKSEFTEIDKTKTKNCRKLQTDFNI